MALAAFASRFPDRDPFCDRQTVEQLTRSAAQWERLTGRSACRHLAQRIATFGGAGLTFDFDGGDDPRTLRYFALELKAEARHLRRIKRGAPPPRPHTTMAGKQPRW